MSVTTLCPTVHRDFMSITSQDVKNLSKTEKLSLLRDITSQQQRCPALVLQVSADLLKGGGGSLGDEVYNIYEQSLIASLDCGNVDLALEHHGKLSTKFGKKSIRVRKLGGMIQEAAGRFDSAVNTYTGILRDALGDAFVVKRLSAMKKSVGDISGAVAVYEEYLAYEDEEKNSMKFLELHSMDLGALRELSALHLRLWNLDKAIHYAEEVILVEPHLYLNHVRYAELCYSQGKTEQCAVSYAHALRLNDGANCARSLYGLWLVTFELQKSLVKKGNSSSSSDVSLPNVNDLNAWAAGKLKSLYTDSPLTAALDLVLKQA